MTENLPKNLQTRIAEAVELVREVSMQTDPQELVQRFRDRMRRIRPRDAGMSLSRRDLESPHYRITRSSRWAEEINPWKERHRLPLFSGGLLGELIYANQPRIINDLRPHPDDPAAEYLHGMRSLLALPLFDRGQSLNMVIQLMHAPDAYNSDDLPDLLITSNLFGRATHHLVLAEQVRRAYHALDAEFQTIAKIQQSLLPPTVPNADGLDIAAYYATAHRAGGDYYDFFPLHRGRFGILIADVSGHGAAAAVVMARMHAALHASSESMDRPADVLAFANEHLLMHCRPGQTVTTFVTSFYAVYDPADRSFTYASAGHNPPRWSRADGAICSISGARELPLGIHCGVTFEQDRIQLQPRDELLLYTDGIVEAFDPRQNQFGIERLDLAMRQPHRSSRQIISNVIAAVERFTENSPAMDDRTMLALRVT